MTRGLKISEVWGRGFGPYRSADGYSITFDGLEYQVTWVESLLNRRKERATFEMTLHVDVNDVAGVVLGPGEGST